MTRRAEDYKIHDSLLFELFSQAMPISIQTIIVSISLITSAKAAKITDKIMDITPVSMNTVSLCNSPSPSSVSSSQHSSNELLMQEIRNEISALRHSRSVSRSRNYNERSKLREQNMCWYYTRFNSKDRKCIAPCNFSGNDKEV